MLDPIRERFIQEFHVSGNGSESVRVAHPKARNWKPQTVHVKASQWLAEPKVQIRLQELRQSSAEKHGITVQSATEMLMADRELARKLEMPAAAISAVMGIAKLHGLIVDKSEVTRKRDVTDISDAELLAIAQGSSSRVIAPQNGARRADPVH